MPTIKKRGSAAKHEPRQDMLAMAHQVSAFMSANRKWITGAVLAVVTVALIVAGYLIMRSLQEQKAAPLLAQAYESYGGAKGKADYPKALMLFTEVNTQYSRTLSGAIAQYYMGNCLVELGKTEDAIKEYQKVIADHSGKKFLLGLAYQRLGYAYSDLGKPAEAIQAFEQADKLVGPGAATLQIARLYEAAGNTAEAQKKYKVILEKLGGTAWAMEAVAKAPQTAPMLLPQKEDKAK